MKTFLYLPKGAKGPVPAFLGLNFRGNQCLEKDPWITPELGYVVGSRKGEDRRAKAEAMRGSAAGRWPVEMILEQDEVTFKDGELVSTKYWNSKGEEVETLEEAEK